MPRQNNKPIQAACDAAAAASQISVVSYVQKFMLAMGALGIAYTAELDLVREFASGYEQCDMRVHKGQL